jgi:electron transfer flavoprotein alpha/beta subunit
VDHVRIVVGFKVTPDYEALRPADWARVATDDPEARAEATRYVRRVVNVFDEAALELALRLRDARAASGLRTSLAAVTVAGREADPFLKTLQALGYEAARVEAGADLDFAPRVTAAVLAAHLRAAGVADALLLGRRCGPGDSGTVPFLVADELGLPCLTEVTEVGAAAAGRLRVTFAAGARPVRATIAPPCVLAVGNAVVSMLRVPTLKERLAARDRPVAVRPAADLGMDVAAMVAGEPAATGLTAVDRSRAGVFVDGATPAAKARALYETRLRARLEQL